jgi:asparagine synthase (glutamine-hydrolysing)
MCGILFVSQASSQPVSAAAFETALRRQRWRGPDSTGSASLEEGCILLGHNRLAIVDPLPRANQPMRSSCGRYRIVFNGEIYNHAELRRELALDCETTSDTETLLLAFARVGPAILDRLDGMFAFVIYDEQAKTWVAARDRFGIKPLYFSRDPDLTVVASEPATIHALRARPPDSESLQELRLVRRPLPGKTYFAGIEELLPGHSMDERGIARRYASTPRPPAEPFDQLELNHLVQESVRRHEMSDVPVVSLLSGGLDSAIVTAFSGVRRAYSVGLTDNNEFDAAQETATHLGRSLHRVELDGHDLPRLWTELATLRGEPLSVPNEALIYAVCQRMASDEKVFLTGEGADELFFGYDNIYRWGAAGEWRGLDDFLRRYGYSNVTPPTDRLLGYIEGMRAGKTLVEFVEDFFLAFHLPGLLRRMDFASMAASKEARVPFVTKSILGYMYRRPASDRIDARESKIPVRRVAQALKLEGPLARRKIGFSATPPDVNSRSEEYRKFYDHCIGALGW